MELVNTISSMGTSSGRPRATIRVTNCGVINDESDEQRPPIDAVTKESLQESLDALRTLERDLNEKKAQIDASLYIQVVQDMKAEKVRLEKMIKQIEYK